MPQRSFSNDFRGSFDRAVSGGIVKSSNSPFLQVLERQMVFGGAERVTKPYREAGFAYACIRAFASAVFSLPLVIRKTSDPDSDPISEDNPVAKRFARPNGHQTLAQLLEAGVTHRKLDGEDIWFLWNGKEPIKPGADGKIDLPTSIIPVRGKDVVNIKQDDRGLPIEYEFPRRGKNASTDTTSLKFHADAVVHFRNYDPDNPLRGLGEVEVAMRAIAIEFQAQRYNEALLRHGGDPGGFIVRDTKPVGVNQEAEGRELEDLTSQPANRGKWKMIYGKNVRIEQTRISPKDLEFGQMLTTSRDNQCTIIGVPPPIIGIMERTIFRNMEVAERLFWKGGSGVMAYLASFLDTLNNFFFPRLRRGPGMDSDPSKYHAEFDTSAVEVLQVDVSEKIKLALEAAMGSAGASFKEVLALLGVPHEENADWDLKSMPSGRVRLEDFIAGPQEESDESNGEDADEDIGDAEELAIENDLGRPKPIQSKDADSEPDPPVDPPTDPPPENSGSDSGGPETSQRVQPDTPEGDARYAYMKDYHERVAKPRVKALKDPVRKWLRKYELAQIARLEDFAARGFDAIPEEERVIAGQVVKIGPDDIIGAASLSQDDIAILLLNRQSWENSLRDIASPIIRQTFDLASADIATEIAGTAFTLQDPAVIAFLETQEIQLVEGVTSRLAHRLKVGLLNEFQGSTSVGRLQELVRELLPDLKGATSHMLKNRDARAQNIARTETAHASNGARYMTAKKNGIEKHEWASAEDEAVRKKAPKGGTKSHVELDGTIVNIGDEFDRRLKYPSDPEAPIGHVAQCRCVARPVMENE